MNQTFFADKILKFIMYNKNLKNKMLLFAVWDFLFQMSLIGLVLFIWMTVLREFSHQNVLYTGIFSALGGAFAAVFDFRKVKSGKIGLEARKNTDTRDLFLIIGAIILYVVGEILLVTGILPFAA